MSALFVGLMPACQQGPALEDRLSGRQSSVLAIPQPGDTIVLDFSADALGNPLPRGAVLGEQFAAAGIHFTGGYILGDRTTDFASYVNTPMPDILICTREGGDPGGCGAPQDRPAAGVPLGITVDFPVCYASIVGRSLEIGTDTGRIGIAGFDAGGVNTGSGASRDILPVPTFPPMIDPMTGAPKVGEGAGLGFMPYASTGPPGNPQQGLDVHSLQISETGLGSLDDLTLVRCVGLQPKCKNQVICTTSADGCMGATKVSVDNGSYDASNNLPVTLSQSPGPPYPLGTTGVTLSVAQGSATATCVGVVSVGDCNAPALVCPPPTTLSCATGGLPCTPYTAQATSTDSCQSQSFSTSTCLDVGTNPFSFAAASVNGARSSCSTTVTVIDTEPPVVTGSGIEIDSIPALSPVDGALHTVALSECDLSITDACDNQVSKNWPSTKITCASSDEDGLCVQMSDDVQVIDEGMEVGLRAKNNAGGASRVYTVHVESKDRSGNTASGDCLFVVPGAGGGGGTGGGGVGGSAGGATGGAAGAGGGAGAGALNPDGGTTTGGSGGAGGAAGETERPDAGSPDAQAGGTGHSGGNSGTGGSPSRPDGSPGEDAGGNRPPRRPNGCSVAGGAPLESAWWALPVGVIFVFRRGRASRVSSLR